MTSTTPIVHATGLVCVRGAAQPGTQTTRRVLDDVALSLRRSEIVALVGKNGVGKSTLLAVLSGELAPQQGQVRLGSSIVCCVGQETQPEPDESVKDRLLRYQPRLLGLSRRVAQGDWSVLDEYTQLGGFAVEARLPSCLREAALDPGELEGEPPSTDEALERFLGRDLAQLSLGQQRRVDLAGAFLAEPDALLLDEPLNYLDLAGIAWFEASARRWRDRGGSMLVVSHDRSMIDALADRTLVLEEGKIQEIQGGYSAAREHLDRQRSSALHRAEQLRRKIRRLEEDARRRMSWAQNKEASKRGAGAAKPHIAKQARKMARRAKDVERRKGEALDSLRADAPRRERGVNLRLEEYRVAKRGFVTFEHVAAAYGEHAVLNDVDLGLDTLARVALLGSNGAGKSTLLRVIMGSLEPSSGSVRRNRAVRSGFLPQGLDGFFGSGSLLECLLERVAVLTGTLPEESALRTALGAAGIRRDRVHLPPDQLSMGERMRGALVSLVMARCEFLILDEPTTHLDLESIETLETLLQEFPGGYLVVSHDRRLIEHTCDDLWQLEAGRIVVI